MASNWISDIAWDPQGRPYRTYLLDGPWGRAGERTYVSPAEVSPSNTSDPRLLQWAATHQAPGGGFLHGRGVWNDDTGQWDQPINGGNLMSLGVGGFIGGPAIAPLFTGGGGGLAAGEAGVIPGTGIPTVSGAGGVAAGVTAPSAASATSAAAGLLPNTTPVPYSAVALEPPSAAAAGGAGGGGLGALTPATHGGAGATQAATGTTSIVDRIKQSLTDPRTYATLAPLLTSLATTGSGGGGSAGSDELRRIQGITEARMRRVDPLHQVATQLAFQRAPIAAKQGIALTNVPLPG